LKLSILHLLKRIAKKIRRRNRVKATSKNNKFSIDNAAKRLIFSNYGLTFSNPAPARAGVQRAEARLAQHRKQWVQA